MSIIYKNANVFGKICDIKVENKKIVDIGNFNEDGIDLQCMKLFPGLVDVHAHGCIGYDTMDAKFLNEMSTYLAKNGTTSWLPTTMTMSIGDIKKAVNVKIDNIKGANVLGFHMEGPYISPKYKGAQNEDFIKSPSIEEFREFENIKIVTIAPELDGSMEFIKNCNAIVSIGHTDADFDCAIEAINNGASCLTHTFNAMPPLHHRNAGVIGAAIDKEIYVQVICDGTHIHKSIIKMLYKTFGRDKVVLISDSMCATGLSDGDYMFGGQKINVVNSVARTEDGAIAGSTSTLFTCVKKAMEFGIPEADAFYMASTTPSKMLGINKGKIEIGYDADFIVTDKDYNIKMTIIGGEKFE